MTSAAALTAPYPIQVRHPRPLESALVAAARRVTNTAVVRASPSNGREWQDESWNMYDLVGELHYLTSSLAGRMAQARLYVGQMPADDTQEPQQVTSGPAALAFDALSTATGRQQMIARMGSGLFIAGEGWIVGIPRYLLEDDEDAPQGVRGPNAAPRPPAQGIAPVLPPPPEPALEDLEWMALSVSEVQTAQGDKVQIHCGAGGKDFITVDPEEVYLIRVWRPHPRLWHEADSPTRASLPVLRELTGLTMHVSAQVDSRLAGAGMLLVPASASAAVRQAAGAEPGTDEDPLTDALMESMITPIRDRASAAAIVPLVVTVPDDSITAFKYMSFSGSLDSEARGLRDEAIRRLALGLDAPPEVLLGTAAQNHWGAWLVREDVVSTHLEPPLALICDALTTQYLQPVLVSGGMDPELARQFVIWYDVSQLVTRPNRFADATTLYKEGVISDAAFRQAGGFSDQDAPPSLESIAATQAMQMVIANPHLAATPGLMELAKELAHLAKMTDLQLATAALVEAVKEPTADEPTVPPDAPAAPKPPSAALPTGGPPPSGPPTTPPPPPAGAP